MLRKEINELLTETDAGKPMGEMFRQYWIPALLASDLPDDDCPPEPASQPNINYLARDFNSFRQLILDRLAVTNPGWQERHLPDLNIALVELLAYLGDALLEDRGDPLDVVGRQDQRRRKGGVVRRRAQEQPPPSRGTLHGGSRWDRRRQR